MLKRKSVMSMMLVLLLTVNMFGVAFAASPVDDLLKQLGSVNSAGAVSQSNSSGGLKDLLLGLVFGTLLNKVLNLPTDVLPGDGKGLGNTKKEVIGFYAENWAADPASFNSLKQHYNLIGTVAPFWGSVNEDGTITTRTSDNKAELMKFANDHKVKTTVLLNNAKSGTSSSPVHQLLNNPENRTNAVANIEEYVKTNDFAGVNIDFELVPPEDRDELTRFMKELSERLRPQGLTVAISVFPKQDETTNDVAIAYDYAELVKYVDQIIIMTYDNHGEWSGPGPVADIRWVESNLKYALQFIPKNKIYLGIAGYGYDWWSGGVQTLDYTTAMETATRHSANVSWDDAAKAPYFKYSDAQGEHQVWFENSRSLAFKLELVNKYDLKGVALWRLGQEAPDYWQTIQEKLR